MPANFCPECGAKAIAGAKFCPECGSGYGGRSSSQPPSSRKDSAEDTDNTVITRSEVSTNAALKDSVVNRSTIKAGGAIDGSVVSRSDVRTESAGIRDAVISHSTITQTETHQHFGESVGTYEAQMDLGRTAFEGKNWQEAVDFFNTALKMDSRGYEPWYYKGMSCAELRRTDEAVTNLRRALKLAGEKAPSLVSDIKSLADRAARAGQLQENSANELIGKARLELANSANYQAQATSGKEKGLAGALALDLFVIPGLGSSMRTTSAVEGLEKRQAADKHEAEGRRLEDEAKGHASEAVRLYNAAIRFCDLILEFQKLDEPIWLRRGELYYRLRLYDDACQSFESVLELNPQNRDALRLRGMCFTAQGKRVPPPPGGAPAQAAPSGDQARPAKTSQPPPPGEPQPEGRRSPMIPQPVPPQTRPAAPCQPQPVMIPPVQPGRAPQQAPPATGGRPSAGDLRQSYRSSEPTLRPGAYQTPAQPRPAALSPPAAPGPAAPQCAAPGAAPGRPSKTNPCPYCRGEMSFVKEKGVWQCGSCRQFSARPMR